jgi:hypothetical protein
MADNESSPAGEPSPPAVVTPVLTSTNCHQELPAWGVTREFRFGQFIRLYDEHKDAAGKSVVTALVLNANGDVVDPEPSSTDGMDGAVDSDQAGNGRRRSWSDQAAGGPIPPVAATTPIGLWETSNFEEALAGDVYTVPVADPEEVISGGRVSVDGRIAWVGVGGEGAAALRRGEAVLAIATSSDGGSSVIRLQPARTTHHLSVNDLDLALATRTIDVAGGDVRLDEASMRSLMQSGAATAMIQADQGTAGVVRLEVEGWESTAPPVATRFAVSDLAEFLAAPVVPARDGTMAELPMDVEAVRELRTMGTATRMVNGTSVTITVVGTSPDPSGPGGELDPRLGPYRLTGKHAYYQRGKGKRTLHDGAAIAASTGEAGGQEEVRMEAVPKFSVAGVPVAVLLPWKQQWKLAGFTRGNLLSSLALAPGEETRITVASWERRAKALEQSSELDSEQTFDFTATTRDTEDVFKEIVQSHEFTSQAHASLDASYSPAFASISVHADGTVGNDETLAVTARTSTQHVREVTSSASTRVRSRRVTRITESVDQGSSTDVVRTIRNPNSCHTLTLNFHEVLAHYDVEIAFNPGAVRLVVLVPNPEPTEKFTPLLARVHEATLRANLLDNALADGFDGCRLLSAYAYAEDEIRRLAGLAKQELDADRPKELPLLTAPKPPNPHLAPLLAILNDIKRRYAPIPTADPQFALLVIKAGGTPTPDQVTAVNRWLWRRLVAAKHGNGLLVALGELADLKTVPAVPASPGTPAVPAVPGPDDARRLLAAMPATTAFPTLDALGSLPESDKDAAGLFGAASAFGGGWWWWYPQLKDRGCYRVSDEGVPGLLTQLRTVFRDWETKEAEGAGIERADAALQRAGDEQQKTTIADRLEMKYGAEAIGAASERQEALITHLNAHLNYYRFVLFQAMPPSEQLQALMATAPQLKVGMFEPHVVSSDGPNLALPLTPLAESTISKVVKNLSARMQKATEEALTADERTAVDRVILTTPGVSVESWLGSCSGCEPHVESMRAAELRREVADARHAELEADRLAARLAAKDYSNPTPAVPLPLHVAVQHHSPLPDQEP